MAVLESSEQGITKEIQESGFTMPIVSPNKGNTITVTEVDCLLTFIRTKIIDGHTCKFQHVPYDVWERQGYLQTTEGNVVHYGYIEKFIERLGERFNIREIAFDRWGAVQMVQQPADCGTPGLFNVISC